LRQQLIQFPVGKILFHLRVPGVVIPDMEAGGYLGPFFQAEALHRFFDFLNAHVNNLARIEGADKAHPELESALAASRCQATQCP
jgi:hypothetical protein